MDMNELNMNELEQVSGGKRHFEPEPESRHRYPDPDRKQVWHQRLEKDP